MTRKEFDRAINKNQLVLSFVGMSNIGKTYWSKKLVAQGFHHIHCDDEIEKRLAPELQRLGYAGIQDVSRWMGQPYQERFAANQERYLEHERMVMNELLERLEKSSGGNTIIDTTGSVIHTGSEICQGLRKRSLVIYIKASDAMKEKMFQLYIQEPKPVVFSDVYVKQEGESDLDSLRRCYPELLKRRSKLYAQCADVIIPRESIQDRMDVEEFLELLKKSL